MADVGKKFAGAAAATTSATVFTPTTPGAAETFLVASATGWPSTGPFVAVLNRGLSDEEKVLVASGPSGTTWTLSARGYDGTTAVAHSAGTTVEHILDAVTVSTLADHVDDDGGDDHDQYMMTDGTRHDLAARHTVGTVINSAVAGASAVGDSAAEGVTTTVARSDHRHSREAFATPGASAPGDAAAAGAATTVVRSDHVHARESYTTLVEAILPPGIIVPYGGSSAPTGWLLCDGSAVSRTTYDALFAVVSTTYGVGDGSTTFNLPNLKGRVAVGVDAAVAAFDTVGETGGAATHTLTAAEMPTHTHTQDAHNHSATTNANEILLGAGDPLADGGILIGHINGSVTVVAATATNQNTGGGGAHNNLPPYLAVHHIIKAH